MEKIDQILESLYDRVIEPMEAKEQLLDLFAVSVSFGVYRGYKIAESIQGGYEISVWDGKEWRFLLIRKSEEDCKQFIDLFLKPNER